MPPSKELTLTQMKAGLDILTKRLKKLGETEVDLGVAQQAELTRAEAGAVDALHSKVVRGAEISSLNEPERAIMRRGLKLLAHNTKAAAGTCRGLGKEEWAIELEEEAKLIEANILLTLDEQRPLQLESGTRKRGAT